MEIPVKIPSGRYLLEVLFVVSNKALFERYSAAIQKVVASVRVQPLE